jgi:hypothetical protein
VVFQTRLVMCHVVSIVVVHDDDGLVDRGEKEKSKGTDDVPVRYEYRLRLSINSSPPIIHDCDSDKIYLAYVRVVYIFFDKRSNARNKLTK